MTIRSGRALLIHAHPGHELRLFHWMGRERPLLFVMTDGSGGGVARTEHSRRCAHEVGAEPSEIFGMAPDRDWYDAILDYDLRPFSHVIDALAATAVAQASRLIVSDAVDGYNPMHDLCEAVAAAAAARLRRAGRPVTHLVSRAIAGGEGEFVVDLRLDAAALQRKRAAVDAYTPLAEEAHRLLAEDRDALSVERLALASFDWPERWRPAWEKIGGDRVAAHKYARRIEYDAHVRPIALALLETAQSERSRCAS